MASTTINVDMKHQSQKVKANNFSLSMKQTPSPENPFSPSNYHSYLMVTKYTNKDYINASL